jgi:Transglycosylase SLT domain
MLSLLSKRSPLLLRVFLTAVSALAAVLFASAFSFPRVTVPLPPKGAQPPAAGMLSDTYVSQLSAAAASAAHARHAAHLAHVQALAEQAAQARAYAAWKAKLAEQAAQAPKPAARVQVTASAAVPAAPAYSGAGVLSAAQVGQLWLEAGGPSWAESRAVQIAYCESGFNPRAYNPSGATGIWQILGAVVPGDLTDPLVNARNAVAKFSSAGGTFAAWVCQ